MFEQNNRGVPQVGAAKRAVIRGATRVRWRRRSIVVLGLCLLALAGCSFGQQDPTPRAAAQASEPVAPVAQVVPTAPPTRSPEPVTTRAAGRIVTQPAEVAAPVISYTGNVVAEDRIDVLAEVAGRVMTLNVEVGDSVAAGDILLELDQATLEARRALALAGLEVAAAQLDLLLQPATQSDIDAANASLAAAQAAYQKALDGPTAEDLRTAEAQLRQAEAAVSQAQSAYDLVATNPNIAAMPQSLMLQQATLQLEAARAQYDKLVGGATADILAAAYAQISQAGARLNALESGAKDGQIRAAEAMVRQAETTLYLAVLELNKATVRAPIDGVVAAVQIEVGAQAGPNGRLVALQSHAVKVEIAVEETRMAELAVGKPAIIRVNAYPDRVFAGEIALIAPALDPTTRTVQVTIRPTGESAALLPGMFATVEFAP